MGGKIDKVLAKLSEKERSLVREIIQKLLSGNTANLNIKKLRGSSDIFRIRKGHVRIMYRVDKTETIFILAIERRKENTYKNY